MEKTKGTPAAVGAVLSVLAAVSCCLPLGTLLGAAGTAGASGLFAGARDWLMPLSVVLLVVAFVQTYRTPCARRSRAAMIVLWTCAVFVVVMLVFPQYVAVAMADWTSR
ncbi:MAG: hypothetical protein JNK87_17670 [Bryobacterales bacterium]|nr:hypothetical protein [Bryobacterales bacterium]